jgi:catechol 2,3-dioxygenase-like lactoylglutathione lyase family enzyme
MTPAPMDHPIDHQITFLHTSDLEATTQFYQETLGLPLALDQGDCRIFRVRPGAYLGFCQRAKASQSGVGIILTLVTDQVDECYEELLELGVTFEESPTYNPGYDIYHCFLRDPNGYLIEIQRFEDSDWMEEDMEA